MTHQHTEEKQLEQLRERIEKGKMAKIQAETRITSLKDQFKRTGSELKALGIDPKDAASKIEEMEKEIQQDLAEIESLLPKE